MTNRDFIIRSITLALLVVFGVGCCIALALYATSNEQSDVRVASIVGGSAILGGLFTAIIAVIGFWITFKTSTAANNEVISATKETKLLEIEIAAAIKQADFRQAWINSLREAVAKYLNEVTNLVDRNAGCIENLRYERLNYQAEFIDLMLNRKEADSIALSEKLRECVDVVTQSSPPDYSKLYKCRREASQLAQKILKAEWDKLRTELRTLKKGN